VAGVEARNGSYGLEPEGHRRQSRSFTEDMRSSQKVEGLIIRNPFL
jgi:hypothetical protein